MIDAKLQIDFWDVGQGDCSVIRLPSGKLIIIDVGPRGSPLVDWLNERRPAPIIDTIILTHNDADHAGAIASVVTEHGARISNIRMLLDRNRDDPQFQKVFRAAREGQAKSLFTIESLRAGDVLWTDQDDLLQLRVVHPSFVQSIEASDANASSAVLVLTSGANTLIAWPGDLELRQTSSAVGNHGSHLLFGPHHGGPTDYPTRSFRRRNRDIVNNRIGEIRRALTLINPKRAFISVGTGNSYHHPRPGYLLLLARQGARTVCSQITRCCDRRHVAENIPIFPGAGMLGLRPARSGTSCRGAVRYYVKDGEIFPDQYEPIHRERIAGLLRPQCLRT